MKCCVETNGKMKIGWLLMLLLLGQSVANFALDRDQNARVFEYITHSLASKCLPINEFPSIPNRNWKPLKWWKFQPETKKMLHYYLNFRAYTLYWNCICNGIIMSCSDLIRIDFHCFFPPNTYQKHGCRIKLLVSL